MTYPHVGILQGERPQIQGCALPAQARDDSQLVDLVVALYQDDRLCLVHDREVEREPQIICSMGLFQQG